MQKIWNEISTVRRTLRLESERVLQAAPFYLIRYKTEQPVLEEYLIEIREALEKERIFTGASSGVLELYAAQKDRDERCLRDTDGCELRTLSQWTENLYLTRHIENAAIAIHLDMAEQPEAFERAWWAEVLRSAQPLKSSCVFLFVMNEHQWREKVQLFIGKYLYRVIDVSSPSADENVGYITAKLREEGIELSKGMNEVLKQQFSADGGWRERKAAQIIAMDIAWRMGTGDLREGNEKDFADYVASEEFRQYFQVRHEEKRCGYRV